jgi:hypothetical protein
MRKQVIARKPRGESHVEGSFFDLERLARVEITSEYPGHPIESALVPGRSDGWRAAEAGPQTVRVLFDEPQRIRRVHLVFEETRVERTQEFALSWTAAGETASRFLVRQQYTFSPGGSTREVEDYAFDLQGATSLELEIVPDIGGGGTHASLVSLRVA